MFDAERSSQLEVLGLNTTGAAFRNNQLQNWLKSLTQKHSTESAAMRDNSSEEQDIWKGGRKNDTLYGLGGNDRLLGRSGNDRLGGNDGQDFLSGDKGNDWLNGGAGRDALLGGNGQDTLVGGTEDDLLLGGIGKDTLRGQSGNDRLWGESGGDALDGGTGQDRLNGGAGNDSLSDSDGGDRLTGGRGSDQFQLGKSQSFTSPSVITDFEIGRDLIHFSDFGIRFADLTFTGRNGNVEIGVKGQVVAVFEGIQTSDLKKKSFRFAAPRLDTQLQQALEQTLSESVSPGATAAVLTADGQLWTDAKGISNIEKNTSSSADDRFCVASIAKSFTATVVMQLVEEGKLSLDATLNQCLPSSITSKIQNSDRITLRQLLSHTSGINHDIMSDYDQEMFSNPALLTESWTPENLLDRYTYGREPSFIPGTNVQYNNANYLLLGLVVQSATNSTIAQEIRERILEPLGLENTFFAGETTATYQPGYLDLDNNGTLDFNTGAADLARYGGAGALISNAEDLARFAQALFNGELVNPDTFREMLTGGVIIPTGNPDIPEVGIGLGINYRDITGQGRELLLNGDVYGWSTQIRYDNNTGTTAVVITNGAKAGDSSEQTTKAVEEILKTVLQNGVGL